MVEQIGHGGDPRHVFQPDQADYSRGRAHAQRSTAPLDQGTPIVMTLSLGERTMNIKGVVAYSDPGHGVGVRFRDLNTEDEALLRSELEGI